MADLKLLHKLWNYFCYCGIEKEEYNAVKKDAYVSNFKVWRILHWLMVAVFAGMFVKSIFSDLLFHNKLIYLVGLIYSMGVTGAFYALKKDSIVAQFLIYLSISVLFLVGAFLTQNSPGYPAVTFVVMLLLTPMFMIDKPFFMGIVLFIASAIFLVWMHAVKPYDVWQMDLNNIVSFSVIGFFIHIIANSIRIREFVLTREIRIQKDIDDLNGLKNKGALTKAINDYLNDDTKDRGMLFIMDIDYFKTVNDTYGHDIGDDVIRQLGDYLHGHFPNDEIVGRFGGDEFVFFLKDTDDKHTALKTAVEVVAGASNSIVLPDKDKKISVSVGIALYHGEEKNYSEIFKKADTALYELKSTRSGHYKLFE